MVFVSETLNMKNIMIIAILFFNFNLLASEAWGIDLGVTSTNFEIEGQSGLGGQSMIRVTRLVEDMIESLQKKLA